MTHNCACGGRLRRSDLRQVVDPKSPIGYYIADCDRKAAHWECDRCHREYSQRKRQPKPKEKA